MAPPEMELRRRRGSIADVLVRRQCSTFGAPFSSRSSGGTDTCFAFDTLGFCAPILSLARPRSTGLLLEFTGRAPNARRGSAAIFTLRIMLVSDSGSADLMPRPVTVAEEGIASRMPTVSRVIIGALGFLTTGMHASGSSFGTSLLTGDGKRTESKRPLSCDPILGVAGTSRSGDAGGICGSAPMPKSSPSPAALANGMRESSSSESGGKRRIHDLPQGEDGGATCSVSVSVSHAGSGPSKRAGESGARRGARGRGVASGEVGECMVQERQAGPAVHKLGD